MLKKIAIRHTTHSGASRLSHPYIFKPSVTIFTLTAAIFVTLNE